MKGTILDFLKLTAEKPELAKELIELATKYDFKFTSDELSDADLDSVAGGGSYDKSEGKGDDGQLASIDLQSALQKQQQTMQTMSNVSKVLHDSTLTVVKKIG